MTSTVTSGLGQANLRSASVTLPLSLALDPNNSSKVCSVAASTTDSCPADTVIGRARVTTPLLTQPLTGNVYLVQGTRINQQGQQVRSFPALLIPLRGRVAIDLRGQTSVDAQSRLVTTFPAVPDVAISSFTLTINGGRKGLLVVTGSANLCRGRQAATAAFTAQSGAVRALGPTIVVPCAKRASVTRLRAVGHALRVLVRLPYAGGLRVSGPGLRTLGPRIGHARLTWLTLNLTSKAIARLHRDGKLRLRLTIRYTPRDWPAQTISTRAVTLRR